MDSLYFYHENLVRVPMNSVEKLAVPLEELLADTKFRIALRLASKVVYGQLEKADFRWANCSAKLRHTLWKYYQRSCSRATPFGAFASIGILPFAQKGSSLWLNTSRSLKGLQEEDRALAEHRYLLHPNLYATGKTYRCTSNASYGGMHSLVELPKESLPSALLSHRDDLSLSYIYQLLADEGMRGHAAAHYLGKLLEEELLLPKPGTKIRSLVEMDNEAHIPEDLPYSCLLHDMQGTLSVEIQKDLLDSIHFLHQLGVSRKNIALEDFKKKFSALYDRQEVPLAMALDVEMGINYLEYVSENEETFHWTAAHGLLLRKWNSQKEGHDKVIRLEDHDLDGFSIPKEKFPPGMMLLYEITEAGISLKQAGGACATAIAARFSLFDERIAKLAKSLCAQEAKSEPEIIFADLNFEGAADGLAINKRKALRPYEINLYGAEAEEGVCQIPLHDLYLKMEGEELYLFSKDLNKRIIPRINSAYNYRHSKWSMVQLLGDMQHEGIRSSLALRLKEFFPEQDFYPAVMYRSIILSPAQWRLPESFLRQWKKAGTADAIAAFKRWALEKQLSPIVYYGTYDQRVRFDIHRESEIACFLVYAFQQEKALMLENCYGHEHAVYPLKDEKGEHYAAEYISFLLNKEKVYEGLTKASLQVKDKRRSFWPLQDWIYLKVYLTAELADDFLLEYLRPFILAQERKRNLLSWHFLRYRDPDFHIRIRLKAHQGKENIMLSEMRTWIGLLEKENGIKKISINSYEREIERYAQMGMEKTEKVFCLSSKMALRNIKRFAKLPPTDQGKHLEPLAIHLLSELLNLGGDATLMLSMTEAYIHRYLIREGKEKRVEFDQHFRLRYPKFAAIDALLEIRGDNSTLCRMVKQQCAAQSSEAQWNFVQDVFHLHCNRLFADAQNETEARCYYLLRKILLAQQKRIPFKEQ